MSPRIAELPPRIRDPLIVCGRVRSISVNPTNSSEVVFAADCGGFWQTSDAMATWYRLDQLHNEFAIDVSYAPDGRTIVATVARDTATDNGGGIWVSPDGGATWSRPRTAEPPPDPRVPDRITAYGISFAPDDPATVYVGTDYGLATSADNGRTWSHEMLETASVVDGDQMQNAVLSVAALPRRRAVALTRTGVYLVDRDAGTAVNLRPGWFANGSKCICVSPLVPETVFIAQDWSALSIYELATGTWTRVPVYSGRVSRTPFVTVGQAGSEDLLEIWFGAGVNLFKAVVADLEAAKRLTASDWRLIGRDDGLHDDTGYLALDAGGRPIAYGCDGGIFKPANADATRWTPAGAAETGLNSLEISDLGGTNVTPPGGHRHTSLYFTTQDNNIWASPDGGRTWPGVDCTEGFRISVRQDARSDAEVTVAYGELGCGTWGPRFSDANLRNIRLVPAVDETGAPISDCAEAFLVSPGKWIRLRLPPGADPELWVSESNGDSWRKRAIVSLPVEGIPAVAGPEGARTVYTPFRGNDARDGRKRVGLIRLDGVFRRRITHFTEADLIYLSNDGSLGIRPTMFDWHAVFGVDPNDPGHIIAPDVNNGVVKVTPNGGASWRPDDALTSAVTRGGDLLLYDDGPSRMQITQISFDPYDDQTIVVGTRDAGIIVSFDRGTSWRPIPDSDVMLYITNFFFVDASNVVVSTYGRGLWTTNLAWTVGPFPHGSLCHTPCIVRDPEERAVRRKVDWAALDVTAFFHGRINGLELSGRRVKRISVTPGATFRRYSGDTSDAEDLTIVESERGVGFGDLTGCLAAVDNEEVIKGVALEKGEVFGIISGRDEWQDPERGQRKVAGRRAAAARKPSAAARKKKRGKRPCLLATTSLPGAGLPVIGPYGGLHLLVRGFAGGAKATPVFVSVIGTAIAGSAKVGKDGTAAMVLHVPDDLPLGEYVVQATQAAGPKPTRVRGSFVKANMEGDEDEDAREAAAPA